MKGPATFFSLLFFAALLVGGARTHAAAAEKKIIYHGWDTRDSAYVREHWQEMEQMPFDGIGIGIALDRSRPTIGDGSTGNLLGWQIFGTKAFHPGSFREALADLRKAEWKRFTDNFLPLAIATRDQDQGLSWFDDARWRTIENNWRVLLTIAREGRCRGILLDPEHYDYECELFNFGHHRAQRANQPFAEYSAQARGRGRQLGLAAREIFPGITVGLLYGYSLATHEMKQGEPRENSRYALLPPFLDGLLEASGPSAKFTDLWESGHGFREARQFTGARNAMKKDALAVTANPAIAQEKLTAGMSLRIDFALPNAPWQAAHPGKNYFTPDAFERALRAALAASDRYVWIYSEAKPRFFPPADLPEDYLAAIRAAKNPRSSPTRTAGTAPFLWAGVGGTLALCALVRCTSRQRNSRRKPGTMRILMVTGIFPPDRGGPASYVPEMARALTRLGHTVEVICLSDTLAHDDSAHPFAVRRIRRGLFWPLRIARTVLEIWRAARRNDLVFVNGLGSESALGALLAGRPAIHKIVGDYAWERAVGRNWFSGTIDEYQAHRKSLTLAALDFVRTLPLKLARRIFVPSNYLARIVGGWRIAPEKISVIHNAVAIPTTKKPIIMLPPWRGRTLITVCRLVPWKGVDALIHALPSLPETRLVVAGDGHLRSELAALAESCGVANRAIFLGDVPHSEIAGCLAQSDAFVLNSTYEGLPHVVLEAMAAGIPVIATDAGGTGEVVEHEATGLLVPVGDSAALQNAVERLWHDPALCRQLTANATALLGKHFDFDVMIRSTEALLLGACERSSSAQSLPVEETP
jgi:glycosyltransferase involved in cell wall biosynthesis